MVAKIIVSEDLDKRSEQILSILEEFELSQNHADVLYLDQDQKLGIEVARKIKDHFSYKPTQAKGKAAVLEDATGLTPEAQNALLKTIEELPEQAIFLLGISNLNGLLPTVLSRCQIITVDPEPKKDDEALYHEIEQLLKSDIKQRFEFVEKLKDKDEFLVALLFYFRKQILTGEASEEIRVFTRELLEAERWSKQNVNIRGILEYLMLILPLHKG